jgi:hypothetical protein
MLCLFCHRLSDVIYNVPFTFVVAVVLNMIVCHGITVLVICLMFGCFAFRSAVNYCKNGLGQSVSEPRSRQADPLFKALQYPSINIPQDFLPLVPLFDVKKVHGTD